MNKNITEQIKLLIDNKLSEKERKALIKKIKKDDNLKIEFALLSKRKMQTRSLLKKKLKEQMPITDRQTIATTALQELRLASFSKTGILPNEDLPIDEDTINDFLEDEE